MASRINPLEAIRWENTSLKQLRNMLNDAVSSKTCAEVEAAIRAGTTKFNSKQLVSGAVWVIMKTLIEEGEKWQEAADSARC